MLIELKFWVDRGGYKVHPVKILFLINMLDISIINEGKRIHILKLLRRGYIRSADAVIKGINQLLKVPIIIGMVIKKIIKSAWIVIII